MDKTQFLDIIGKYTYDKANGTYNYQYCPICGAYERLKIDDSGGWLCDCTGGEKKTLLDLKQEFLKKYPARKDVAELIVEKETPTSFINMGEIQRQENIRVISTGFETIDNMTGGFQSGSLFVITGKRGEGKSTFAGQLALNAVEQGKKVCFYSGELSSFMFQNWIYTQAAGNNNVESVPDVLGMPRWQVKPEAANKIASWLDGKLWLYDNRYAEANNKSNVIKGLKKAKVELGCELFFVDNLMTAYAGNDGERDFYRAQSKFVIELVNFASEYNVCVVLIAHPKKSYTDDINDNVSGSADITNLASVVIGVRRSTSADITSETDAILTIGKNRLYGTTGAVGLCYDSTCRQLSEQGKKPSGYSW